MAAIVTFSRSSATFDKVTMYVYSLKIRAFIRWPEEESGSVLRAATSIWCQGLPTHRVRMHIAYREHPTQQQALAEGWRKVVVGGESDGPLGNWASRSQVHSARKRIRESRTAAGYARWRPALDGCAATHKIKKKIPRGDLFDCYNSPTLLCEVVHREK
jgi:hypothetical protein